MFKKNNIRFGVLLGFIAPLLSLVIYYFVRFYPLYSVNEFLTFVAENKNQVTAISVPCLILNIALFTYYINSQKDQTAKGIFAITLIYAIGSLLLKFIL